MYEPHYDAGSCAIYFVDGAPGDPDVLGGRTNVFVCGALQDPGKMASLLGRNAPFAPAVARGYRRTRASIAGREVPFMATDPDDPERVLTGVVWLDLSVEDLERIEGLELEGGLRVRVAIDVTVGERTIEAITYLRR